MKTNLHRLFELGQSIWCDNISRRMIESGELQRLIDAGVVGVTSNPTIFMKAITSGSDYDGRLAALLDERLDTYALYERLVLDDIADAADILRPVYDRTRGADGYVSLEVNPKLAYDTQATMAEARRLFEALARPNIFIKVPATEEGIPAIESLIGAGVNVNVTLIFGLGPYERVMQAYLAGLARLARDGGRLDRVASVASFFVSRVDTLVDKKLAARQAEGAAVDHLFGQAAIANAKFAYARFVEVFDHAGPFGALATRGARVQRPLWASTSTKDPRYSDTIYADNLVGRDTVNTLPPATLEAVLDHGNCEVTIGRDLDLARAAVDELAELGITMHAVTEQLRTEGVAAFAQSFDELLANLAGKNQRVRATV
ncbi:MAG: transaldolase [Planctomycetes bacterium]|nr:transaldolase [Planctomycetota bacterium]